MDQLIKRNIRLLSERFNHSIEYSSEYLLINSDLNSIKVSPNSKYGFIINYNSESGNVQIEIELEDIYDVLIELLRRKELYQLKAKTEKLICIEDWTSEEGDWIIQELKELHLRLENESFDFIEIGGNRFEGEYYKGLLILTDDLCWNKSNVIEFNTLRKNAYKS